VSKLMVVDDEQSICWGLSQLGTSIGHEVVTLSSAEQALERAGEFQPDVIVLDVRLPGIDGISAISKLRERAGEVPIIVMTAYGDLKTAVDAVRHGAFEYIIKPFDLEQVERALRRALASPAEPAEQPGTGGVGGLVGKSAALQLVFKNIALAAASNASVLLAGESGTGKELAARAIHQYSDRAAGPFVAVNVASLSPTIAESELFGHERGSFTGADQSRTGLLAQADGGTLFLDEVADIPMTTQVKLLRALEHGEVTPVGSNKPVKTNFRVVSATHQDLLQAVNQGTFRHDLYFRLCAFQITLPPLRERREDVAELANHFLQMVHRGNAPAPTISDAAFRELESRPWHGNVRELRNTIEHAVIVARSGVIGPEHFPPPTMSSPQEPHDETSAEGSIAGMIRAWTKAKLRSGTEITDLHEQMLRLVEPPLFGVVLDKHDHQFAAAARVLGIHRTTLRKRFDQYDMPDDPTTE